MTAAREVESVSEVATDVAAVIVDFHAGQALDDCVDSLHANGVTDIVVVENGDEGSTLPALSGQHVVLVVPKLNLGYGRGVNRGVAAAPARRYLLVSNPDVVVHEGAVAALVAFLDDHPNVAIVGPQIVRPDGSVYPSQRVFPNFWLAGLHALLAPLWPSNPFTRRYRSPRKDGSVDWVSGAFFLARRDRFEEVGGFDERYFMFAEDMALCWQMRAHGLRRRGHARRAGHAHRGRLARAGLARDVDRPSPQRHAIRVADRERLAARAGADRDAGARSAPLRGAGHPPHDLRRPRLEWSLGCEWFCG